MPDFARQATQRLSSDFGTQAQLDAINQMFAGLMGSQGGQAQLAGASRAGQVASNALTHQLSRTGGAGTGIGRLSAGLGAAGSSVARTGAISGLFGQAQQGGIQNLLARLQAMPGLAKQLQSQDQGFDWMKLLTQVLGGVSMAGAARLGRPRTAGE